MNRTADVHIPEEQLDHIATRFIKTASGYPCQISIMRGAHCINGKSLLGFLSLMRDSGSVTLAAEGTGAEEALAALSDILGMR